MRFRHIFAPFFWHILGAAAAVRNNNSISSSRLWLKAMAFYNNTTYGTSKEEFDSEDFHYYDYKNGKGSLVPYPLYHHLKDSFIMCMEC